MKSSNQHGGSSMIMDIGSKPTFKRRPGATGSQNGWELMKLRVVVGVSCVVVVVVVEYSKDLYLLFEPPR
jgi:hypothetical protein